MQAFGMNMARYHVDGLGLKYVYTIERRRKVLCSIGIRRKRWKSHRATPQLLFKSRETDLICQPQYL